MDSTIDTVVPYMVYREHKRPIEIAPETPDAMLEEIATMYMDQPTKVRVSRRPIRTGDELVLTTLADAQMTQEIKLQALREADKYVPKPPVVTTAPPTMQQVFHQAPPRAQSREITPSWEIAKPQACDYARQGNCVPVILQIDGERGDEHNRRKVYINST
jgi:hypothetical protein